MTGHWSQYRAVVEPVYNDLRACFVGLAGSILLADSGASPDRSDRGYIRDEICPSLSRSIAYLRRVAVPRCYRERHARLLAAASGLDHLVDDLIAHPSGRSPRVSKCFVADLKNAYRNFQHGGIPEMGMRPVDLLNACCGGTSVMPPTEQRPVEKQ